MMHATLHAGLVQGLGERVNVFGEQDAEEAVRIPLTVTAHVSFADLLALILKFGNLVWDELGDDQAVRGAVNFSLLSSDLVANDTWADWAMDAYHGRLADLPTVPSCEWAHAVGDAITRVYGMTA